MTNSDILRRLRFVFNFNDDMMIKLFALGGKEVSRKLVDLRVSKHEINAFFRKETQSQYRKCKDQFLRNFIYGLQIKFRPDMKLFQSEEE